MSFLGVMEVGVFLVGKAFFGGLFGMGVRQFFVKGSFFAGGVGLCMWGCQLFAGLTKVIAWGRLSTV